MVASGAAGRLSALPGQSAEITSSKDAYAGNSAEQVATQLHPKHAGRSATAGYTARMQIVCDAAANELRMASKLQLHHILDSILNEHFVG